MFPLNILNDFLGWEQDILESLASLSRGTSAVRKDLLHCQPSTLHLAAANFLSPRISWGNVVSIQCK